MKSRSQYIPRSFSLLPWRGEEMEERSKSSPGFSLMEMVVVIGLLGLIAAFGLFISMDFYRGSSFHSERNIIISVLQKARSRAVNNINESPHGVHFQSDMYIIFEGAAWPSATVEEIPISNNVANSGGDVVFAQLTGEGSGAGSIILTAGSKTSTVTINNEGQISW